MAVLSCLFNVCQCFESPQALEATPKSLCFPILAPSQILGSSCLALEPKLCSLLYLVRWGAGQWQREHDRASWRGREEGKGKEEREEKMESTVCAQCQTQKSTLQIAFCFMLVLGK